VFDSEFHALQDGIFLQVRFSIDKITLVLKITDKKLYNIPSRLLIGRIEQCKESILCIVGLYGINGEFCIHVVPQKWTTIAVFHRRLISADITIEAKTNEYNNNFSHLNSPLLKLKV
jgi:hypothetical protein